MYLNKNPLYPVTHQFVHNASPYQSRGVVGIVVELLCSHRATPPGSADSSLEEREEEGRGNSGMCICD